MFGSGFVYQFVHRIMKARLRTGFMVGLHVEGAVSLESVTFEIFGKVAGLDIGTSTARSGSFCLFNHSIRDRQNRAKIEHRAFSATFSGPLAIKLDDLGSSLHSFPLVPKNRLPKEAVRAILRVL